MDVADILAPGRTHIGVDVQSRKRALEWISEQLAEHIPALRARDLFQALQARERLGSTGLGEGVAIPHCRIHHDRILGLFVRLARPIDFDAPDGEPVDLLFALLVPEGEAEAHLKVLSQLASAFSNEDLSARLRVAGSAEDLRAILIEGCTAQDG
ncbi:MAG: PTS IIA-like nitrogen regulatory protein PtsN [Pseudomonadales bacterium]|nr:PTS IIA-like nitrogen regulatory protein PtsN [Pseudomonadales bacterium]MCP5185387.1 PTS IIA-like nitrogen regulatory protein PtsN [Pseudomonadales bacterium]